MLLQKNIFGYTKGNDFKIEFPTGIYSVNGLFSSEMSYVYFGSLAHRVHLMYDNDAIPKYRDAFDDAGEQL